MVKVALEMLKALEKDKKDSLYSPANGYMKDMREPEKGSFERIADFYLHANDTGRKGVDIVMQEVYGMDFPAMANKITNSIFCNRQDIYEKVVHAKYESEGWKV